MAQAEDFLEYSAAKSYKDVIREMAGEILIQREPLFALHTALRSYLVRMALENLYGDKTNLKQAHVDAVMELFEKQVGRERHLPDGGLAKRVYEGVCLEMGQQRKEQAAGTERKAEWKKKQETEQAVDASRYEFSVFSYEKGMKIPQNQYTKWFDYDKIKGMVSVRHRKTGDFITISGGGRKSVKEYMIHEKIPRECRDKVELVADGSHILWIVGWRISEMYKVTEDTKRILQIRLDGGTQDGR